MKLKIDLSNPEHVVAAAAFFNSLNGAIPGETIHTLEAAKPARRTRALKPETTKPEAAKPETTKPEAAKPETTKPETTKPEDPSALEELRKEAAKLLPKFKKEFRTKLDEMGFNNLTSMTSDKYPEFLEFIKSLDNAGA